MNRCKLCFGTCTDVCSLQQKFNNNLSNETLAKKEKLDTKSAKSDRLILNVMLRDIFEREITAHAKDKDERHTAHLEKIFRQNIGSLTYISRTNHKSYRVKKILGVSIYDEIIRVEVCGNPKEVQFERVECIHG